jgi:hypothetical protein
MMLYYSTLPHALGPIGLDCRIPTSTSTALHSSSDLARKVLCNVRDITDRIAVGQQVPAASAVAVVVEPGSEDKVGGYGEEEAVIQLDLTDAEKHGSVGTYMMKNHPKKPQWLPPSTGGASSHAYCVRHSSLRVLAFLSLPASST